MKIVNLTPHALNLFNAKSEEFDTIEPSGVIARVSCKTVKYDGEFDAPYNFTTNSYGDVENLPNPEENTIFVVSALVAGRVPHRNDVFIPNESVRDDKGRIIGCKSLGHI